jgi:hypothetical protein
MTMTEIDPAARYLRLLELRDETRASISDKRIDEIREQTRQDLIKVISRGISRLEKLSAKRKPARAVRVNGEVEWMRALIQFMGGLNS